MPVPQSDAVVARPRQLVRERVLEEIRTAILTGVLLPGERLEEAALRGWLGVSATPIRQALHVLVTEGLVQSAPQSHTIVATPQHGRIEANMQAAGVLLVGITALTLPVLTDDEREGLADRAERIASLIDRRDIPAASQLAGEYFLLLIDRCPNPVLVELTRRTGTTLGYHISTTHAELGDDLESVARAYGSLPRALRERDFQGVLAATRRAFLIDPRS